MHNAPEVKSPGFESSSRGTTCPGASHFFQFFCSPFATHTQTGTNLSERMSCHAAGQLKGLTSTAKKLLYKNARTTAFYTSIYTWISGNISYQQFK